MIRSIKGLGIGGRNMLVKTWDNVEVDVFSLAAKREEPPNQLPGPERKDAEKSQGNQTSVLWRKALARIVNHVAVVQASNVRDVVQA